MWGAANLVLCLNPAIKHMVFDQVPLPSEEGTKTNLNLEVKAMICP